LTGANHVPGLKTNQCAYQKWTYRHCGNGNPYRYCLSIFPDHKWTGNDWMQQLGSRETCDLFWWPSQPIRRSLWYNLFYFWDQKLTTSQADLPPCWRLPWRKSIQGALSTPGLCWLMIWTCLQKPTGYTVPPSRQAGKATDSPERMGCLDWQQKYL
jgi:hypothetical protein